MYPERTNAIDSYLDYRQRYGERITENSPLIREEFDTRSEIEAARPRHLGTESFKYMIQKVGLDSGVIERIAYTRSLRHAVKLSHGFRKFFQTASITNGMSPIYSEFLMGHQSGGLPIESYTRPTEKDLLEGNDKMIGYIGVIDVLTINEENKLRKKVNKLEKEKGEFDQLRREMDELRNFMWR